MKDFRYHIAGTREVKALRDIGAIDASNCWIIGSKLRSYLRAVTLVPSGERMLEIVSHKPQDGFLSFSDYSFQSPQAREIANRVRRTIEKTWAPDHGYFHLAREGAIAAILETLVLSSPGDQLKDTANAYDAVIEAVEAKIRAELRATEDLSVLNQLQLTDEDLLTFPYLVEQRKDRGRRWQQIIAGQPLGRIIREAHLREISGERHPGYDAVLEWVAAIRERTGASAPMFLTFRMPEISPRPECVEIDPASATNPLLSERGQKLAS